MPTWARKAGCPVKNEPLGTDYAAAVQRAETVLLPRSIPGARAEPMHCRSACGPARSIGCSPSTAPTAAITKLDARTKRNHEVGFRLVGGYVLKDGRRLGDVRLAAITTAVTDALYEKLLVVTETDADGNAVERERRTTVNHAMKTCRRAWNVAARRNPGKVPPINPFAQMGLQVVRPRDADRDL